MCFPRRTGVAGTPTRQLDDSVALWMSDKTGVERQAQKIQSIEQLARGELTEVCVKA